MLCTLWRSIVGKLRRRRRRRRRRRSQGQEIELTGDQLDWEIICCPICLELLKNSVTIPCGHSYCMKCIKAFWDTEDDRMIYSCPLCRQTFRRRSKLMKSIMLAALVKKLKPALEDTLAEDCYAGPEDVACDVCMERKLKALKTCLNCVASVCEKHLQLHYESSPYMKHQLVEPSKKLQENICSYHNKVMKMFCRTDQLFICYLCSVDEHKGHNIISAVAEMMERQRKLELNQQEIQPELQDREDDVKVLKQRRWWRRTFPLLIKPWRTKRRSSTS
ncbi:E3 ubiquitin/ISG15 ligase TRIM25-like [Solea solea]|uniref:E3 ubiquitin/ISG15 ligase TRIM25-like n=1 Tax=Solea solea TaxID=90069 RepID=UPI00272B9CFD|nr:E3 ubiquitin/ISG15 ligase TRIM25-like [Solea solea]